MDIQVKSNPSFMIIRQRENDGMVVIHSYYDPRTMEGTAVIKFNDIETVNKLIDCLKDLKIAMALDEMRANRILNDIIIPEIEEEK